MTLVFNVAMHALLVVAMLAFLLTLANVVVRTDDPMERLRRSLALFAGAMVVIGAQAAGISFALFSTGALGTARGASLAANTVSSVIPAVAGAGLGFYLVREYRKNESRALRLVCFVGTLSLAAFAEVYAQATSTNGVLLGAAAIPNLTFTVGVVLVFVFSDTPAERHANGPSALSQFVRSRTGQFGGPRGAGRDSTQVPGQAAAPSPAPARDPFDF